MQATLEGLRVIDLTQNVAGPFCTQILGDLGAEVIKVERPGRGDDTRDWRPPELGGHSATFLALNRNKKSICIDLSDRKGVEVLKSLAKNADILVHSLKPGSAEQRGFGFDDLKAINPNLIYCAISAFGQTGPLKGLPGYDPLMQAFTGIMSTTGAEGQDPVRVGVSLIDMGTGIWAALGIFAAIMQRAKKGRGGIVEVSLLETGVSWMTIFAAGYLATSQLPKKFGSGMAMTAPYELFRARDGMVFIAAGNDRLFECVCIGLGCPELCRDPRFSTNPSRVANREALRAEIEARTLTQSAESVVSSLRAAGAPCSEMNDTAQMLAHEQVLAMRMVHSLPVDGAEHHKVIALPLSIDGERGALRTAPPALGSDTDILLGEAGYDCETISRFRSEGVVG